MIVYNKYFLKKNNIFIKKSIGLLLKLLLTSSIIITIISFILPNFQKLNAYSSVSKLKLHNDKIINSQISAIDTHGKPYILFAKELNKINKNKICMFSMQNDFFLKNQKKINIKSDKGYFKKTKNYLKLNNNICIKNCSKYILKILKINLKYIKNNIISTCPIIGSHPNINLEAKNGVLITRKENIYLKGNSHLILCIKENNKS